MGQVLTDTTRKTKAAVGVALAAVIGTLAVGAVGPGAALAASLPVQTDATSKSVTATYELPSYASSAQPTYVEASPAGETSWKRVEASELTASKVIACGLKPGTRYNLKVHYTYGSGYDGSCYISGITTVAGKAEGLKIGSMYPSTKRMSVAFTNPGCVYGYEVRLDAYSGKKASKTIKGGWSYGNDYAETIESDVKSMSMKTAYKAKARTYVLMGNGTKKWSPWSDMSVLVPQPDVKGKKSGSGAQLSWTKVQGAKNYTVYKAKADGSAGAKLKTIKSLSAKVKSSKTGYVVHANVRYKGKTYSTPDMYYIGWLW